MSVDNKVVVITGGASGVGRFIARKFAAAGSRVVIADVAPMDTVLDECTRLDGEAIGIATDVTNEESVRKLFSDVYKTHGRIDVLLNDAGIVTHFGVGAPRWSRIRDMDRNFFNRVIETNLGGTFLCAKHAVPYMESLQGGHIINFGQGNLQRPNHPSIGSCVYHTSKVAIRAFTVGLADEVRESGICVVSMGPGAGGRGGGPRSGIGGIVTDDSPAWTHDPNLGGTSVESVGDRYLLAAEADMSFSGAQVAVRDGELVVVDD